ncbi:MAG: S1 family peptidase [Defluviitaleaceae bacterium]|nr:S1 family peptidase [Defluviitaleaceae bacterium]
MASVEEFYTDIGELEIFGAFDLDEALMLLEDYEVLAVLAETREIMELQTPAVDAYNVLMDAFRNEYGEIIYPDNYAGAFVEHDTLVIQLTDTSAEVWAFYTNLLAHVAPISYKQVDFSMNQLVTFGEMFVDAIDDSDARIVSFGVDTLNNVYSITLYQNCSESAQLADSFNETRRFLPMPVAIDMCMPAEVSMLWGGNEIRNARQVPFSIGLTGTRPGTGAPALITAGHAFVGLQTGTQVFSGGQPIGTLQAFRVGHHFGGSPTPGQAGDWAVIGLNPTGAALMTNQLRNGFRVQGHSASVPVNTRVMGTGHRTIHWEGNVLGNRNVRIYDRNVYQFTMWAQTSVTPTFRESVGGDSGGTIFRESGGIAIFVGIHTAASVNNATGVTVSWYFCPLANFSSHFSPRITAP